MDHIYYLARSKLVVGLQWFLHSVDTFTLKIIHLRYSVATMVNTDKTPTKLHRHKSSSSCSIYLKPVTVPPQTLDTESKPSSFSTVYSTPMAEISGMFPYQHKSTHSLPMKESMYRDNTLVGRKSNKIFFNKFMHKYVICC